MKLTPERARGDVELAPGPQRGHQKSRAAPDTPHASEAAEDTTRGFCGRSAKHKYHFVRRAEERVSKDRRGSLEAKERCTYVHVSVFFLPGVGEAVRTKLIVCLPGATARGNNPTSRKRENDSFFPAGRVSSNGESSATAPLIPPCASPFDRSRLLSSSNIGDWDPCWPPTRPASPLWAFPPVPTRAFDFELASHPVLVTRSGLRS